MNTPRFVEDYDPYDKHRILYRKIVDAATSLGFIVLIDKMYVIDRETGQATTMQVLGARTDVK